jgi:5-formyltetrahydrofolate cyclo-ligase
MSFSPSKPELRRQLALRVRSLSETQRRSYDEEIRTFLAGSDAYRSAVQVLAYVAFRDEPEMEPLLAAALRDGKHVFVPLEVEEGLRFHVWTPELGRDTGAAAAEPRSVPSLVLVPGRGFDRLGGRLGRGRGCYDRALPALRRLGPVVGVAYECQLVAVVPQEPHDERVDAIVTEAGLRYPPRQKGNA